MQAARENVILPPIACISQWKKIEGNRCGSEKPCNDVIMVPYALHVWIRKAIMMSLRSPTRHRCGSEKPSNDVIMERYAAVLQMCACVCVSALVCLSITFTTISIMNHKRNATMNRSTYKTKYFSHNILWSVFCEYIKYIKWLMQIIVVFKCLAFDCMSPMYVRKYTFFNTLKQAYFVP